MQIKDKGRENKFLNDLVKKLETIPGKDWKELPSPEGEYSRERYSTQLNENIKIEIHKSRDENNPQSRNLLQIYKNDAEIYSSSCYNELFLKIRTEKENDLLSELESLL